MHKSAYISGGKFFSRYVTAKSPSILEVGSFNVNGTLRDFQPEGSNWVGVDIEIGPGVDLVIQDPSALPFKDLTFDYVIASSVFEHDPTFWSTFREMVRVLKNGGSIYINSPSNGMIHRYPLDVYRFYPDAGKALEKWGRSFRPDLRLAESFIGKHDLEPWNDFCAVFTVGKVQATETIFSDTDCENVWIEDTFLEHTFAEFPQDLRIVGDLENKYSDLENKYSDLENKYSDLENKYSDLENKYSELLHQYAGLTDSKSWRVTRPLRCLLRLFRK
jgi:SAM-dependent methyltransferase